jgi:choline dehydrogenase
MGKGDEMQYDYVIVGGGSAGCVLANRLTADGRHTVCLLEAGPADRHPFIMIPGGVIQMLRSKIYNWNFWTAPQQHLGGRSLFWPRGRTLGGSSAINAMCYIRGNAWDYDHWASLGNTGWGYRDVLPYFRRAENYEPGANDFHGAGGPLNVAALRSTNPLSQAYLAACDQAGLPPTADFNGAQQEGMGFYKVMQKGGQRCSNARAYLREAESRPNLTVVTGAHATRVLFDGKKAVGVRYFANGHYVDAHAAREVVLAAGAIGSPQLLLLSGVGPGDELRRHGIAQVHELPGVGRNLQDHLGSCVCVRAKTRVGLSFHPWSLWRTLKGLFRYLFFRDGELTSNIAEAGGFMKSSSSQPIPDLQFHFLPVVNVHHGLDLTDAFRYYGYCILVYDLRPRSRGHIGLQSADPIAPPLIQPNYASDPYDLDKLVVALKKAREVLAQPAFEPHRQVELEPGATVQTDDALREWIRGHAETLYHPVGTCKMGLDEMAVVDPQLRVRGVEGLRVVDASIMPTLVGGNTNAPTTMIGEKGAAMMLQQAESGARLAA